MAPLEVLHSKAVEEAAQTSPASDVEKPFHEISKARSCHPSCTHFRIDVVVVREVCATRRAAVDAWLGYIGLLACAHGSSSTDGTGKKLQ